MRATKHTIEIIIEVLSPDSVHALLLEVTESYCNENNAGRIHKADGDEAKWETIQAPVVF